MSQSGESFPRPGVASDLHEWAKSFDEQQREAHSSVLQAAQDRHLEIVEGMFGSLSEEQKLRLEESLTSLYGLAVAKARYEFGPRMTDVFDGQAMNA